MNWDIWIETNLDFWIEVWTFGWIDFLTFKNNVWKYEVNLFLVNLTTII